MAELRGRVFMEYEDGHVVPFESLTKEEVDEWWERASKRISTGLNAYYREHPDEYAKL